jgi:hypothetical protein
MKKKKLTNTKGNYNTLLESRTIYVYTYIIIMEKSFY